MITTCSIVFVHGLRGHPRRTWESPRSSTTNDASSKEGDDRRHLRTFLRSKLTRSPNSNNGKDKPSAPDAEGSQQNRQDPIFWPKELLAPSMPSARILTYGYNADAIGGLFQSNNQNSISQHGNDLMVKLERAVPNDVRPRMTIVSQARLLIVALRSQSCLSRTA